MLHLLLKLLDLMLELLLLLHPLLERLMLLMVRSRGLLSRMVCSSCCSCTAFC
jgi:hypothetical protein